MAISLLMNKKEQITNRYTKWINLKGIIQCEKNQIQKATYILYNSIYTTFWKRPTGTETRKKLPGARVGGRVDYNVV